MPDKASQNDTSTLTLRVPRELSDAYGEVAKITGVSKSRLAGDALEAYLGMLRAGWIAAPDPRLRPLVERAAGKRAA